MNGTKTKALTLRTASTYEVGYKKTHKYAYETEAYGFRRSYSQNYHQLFANIHAAQFYDLLSLLFNLRSFQN